MEVLGPGEEINTGPLKERETRKTTVPLTKSQDHLDSQVRVYIHNQGLVSPINYTYNIKNMTQTGTNSKRLIN